MAENNQPVIEEQADLEAKFRVLMYDHSKFLFNFVMTFHLNSTLLGKDKTVTSHTAPTHLLGLVFAKLIVATAANSSYKRHRSCSFAACALTQSVLLTVANLAMLKPIF